MRCPWLFLPTSVVIVRNVSSSTCTLRHGHHCRELLLWWMVGGRSSDRVSSFCLLESYMNLTTPSSHLGIFKIMEKWEGVFVHRSWATCLRAAFSQKPVDFTGEMFSRWGVCLSVILGRFYYTIYFKGHGVGCALLCWWGSMIWEQPSVLPWRPEPVKLTG